MKLCENRILNQFVAAATLSSFGFVSARIRAPQREGYDPTAPAINRNPGSIQDQKEHYIIRPSSESIDDTLRIVSLSEEVNAASILKNTTNFETTESTNSTDDSSVDIGIISPSRAVSAPAQVPSLYSEESTYEDSTSSTCMMGYEKDELLPAETYIQNKIDRGVFEHGKIIFDKASNTIFCNQNFDDAGVNYGCASMYFSGCRNVKCNGKSSCVDVTIEGADTIECEGFESCREANLDARIIDCGGKQACMNATIGELQKVDSLDCHSGESACAYSNVHSVGEVFCTGPLSCYGSQLMGVTNTVSCQGVPHPGSYYMPTCGGGYHGSIQAATGYDIDVVCDGDFACIGFGNNKGDEDAHHKYFEMDVGANGSLTCEGSLQGNQDGFTFVCRYIDVTPGCANFDCHEPSFALADHTAGIDSKELRTCEKVFGHNDNRLCSERPLFSAKSSINR